MAIKRFIFLIVTALAFISLNAGAWVSDALYTDSTYCHRTVIQPSDYAGTELSTIIRKLPQQPTSKGVLYIHGFNDYFFNTEMGNEFVDHDYAFYAVDLRKYGRSLRSGQHRYQVRDLKEYFPDIDSAIVDMHHAGIQQIVLMGHSTGGLIAALYMSQAAMRTDVDALILNSPFLDWNLGKIEWLVPVVNQLGRWFPNLKISQGNSTAYAESLLSRYHGRWNYDTSLKLINSPDVDAGWVRAISQAQKDLRDGRANIRVPILLMYSARSDDADNWTAACDSSDTVLDVKDIRKYGLELGDDVSCLKVVGGLHDLMLSSKGLTTLIYNKIFSWLDENLKSGKN